MRGGWRHGTGPHTTPVPSTIYNQRREKSDELLLNSDCVVQNKKLETKIDI